MNQQLIYRYHADQKDGKRYYYSTNAHEENGWKLDKVVFSAPVGIYGVVPVFQFHCKQSETYGGWRFNYCTTMDPVRGGWTYDNVAFYAFKNQSNQTVPIYQYYRQQDDGLRFYFGKEESLPNKAWVNDGIAFWVYP